MDIHVYVGDSQETPYECTYQTQTALHWILLDGYFLSIQCSEIAPEGQTVKIIIQYIYLLILHEVEVYGRSLSSKCYDLLD